MAEDYRDNGNVLGLFLSKAGSMPGIRIDREKYLEQTFKMKYRKDEDIDKINEIVYRGPIAVGVPMKEINKLANKAINAEALQTTLISAGTGVAGGVALAATIPADIIQLYGHLFRVIQKLMYLYGWNEDIFDGNGNIDDGTMGVMVIYLGLMFGVEMAGELIAQITAAAAKKILRQVPVKVVKALVTKQAFREVVKKIVKAIGIKTSMRMAASASSKVVPIVGAMTSGALTAVLFIPMTRKLKTYFENGGLEKGD